MQSKMTEREFRRRFAMRGLPSDGAGVDAAIEVAREAGLEFAPEPKLPERLTPELSFGGKPNWCWLNEAGERVLDLSLSLTSSEKTQEKEIVTAAFERASAYPGLRAAAETVIARIYDYLGKPPCYKHPITDILTPLEAELAKGPK